MPAYLSSHTPPLSSGLVKRLPIHFSFSLCLLLSFSHICPRHPVPFSYKDRDQSHGARSDDPEASPHFKTLDFITRLEVRPVGRSVHHPLLQRQLVAGLPLLQEPLLAFPPRLPRGQEPHVCPSATTVAPGASFSSCACHGHHSSKHSEATQGPSHPAGSSPGAKGHVWL